MWFGNYIFRRAFQKFITLRQKKVKKSISTEIEHNDNDSRQSSVILINIQQRWKKLLCKVKHITRSKRKTLHKKQKSENKNNYNLNQQRNMSF